MAGPRREMLTMLLASFDEVEPILAAALEGSADDADVLAQLHRLNGGCAYSGVPGLQRLLSQLEQQLRGRGRRERSGTRVAGAAGCPGAGEAGGPRYLALTD